MKKSKLVVLHQGDIILVPFPFTDLRSQKTRPALVLSKQNLSEDVVVSAITSKRSKKGVKFTALDLDSGDIPITSYVRCDKVVTLHRSLVKKKVSSLKAIKLREVLRVFRSQF